MTNLSLKITVQDNERVLTILKDEAEILYTVCVIAGPPIQRIIGIYKGDGLSDDSDEETLPVARIHATKIDLEDAFKEAANTAMKMAMKDVGFK